MAKSAQSVTPMMAQYLDIKARYKDALLFYRMGDFYELFFEDAVVAAQALNIALTKRGKHDGDDIPMCGVPHHSAESYLLSLIKAGFRVAICEQLESPQEAKKRGSKSVVKRDVVRLVTPGTLAEETLLRPKSNNFLAAMHVEKGLVHLVWCDVSTSESYATSISPLVLIAELMRIGPAETILSSSAANLVGEQLRDAKIDFHLREVDECKAQQIETFFGTLETKLPPLKGGQYTALEHLLGYIGETLKDNKPHLSFPVQAQLDKTMFIDAATRRNLEINTSISGDPAHGLLRAIDQCKTSSGARLLSHRLNAPSFDLDEIKNRLDLVEHYCQDHAKREDLRKAMTGMPDMARGNSRLGMGYGGPRDLRAILWGLRAAHIILPLSTAPLDRTIADMLRDLDALCLELENALKDDVPLLSRDGGFIKEGFDNKLDHYRALEKNGRSALAALQAKYIALTNITSLKVKHNNVLGYFVETPATHAQKMQSPSFGEVFIHRQTTANQIRFTTDELAMLQTDLLEADSAALALEQAHFDRLRQEVLRQSAQLSVLGHTIAQLDVAAGLAQVAVDRLWSRPSLDHSTAFEIEQGRHPVVEAALQNLDGSNFVANACHLSERPLMLITGPNMAGKSTFLRQNALIVLLAQMGSFVPAQSANFGLVSSLFSRVGASDDLAQGQSTFMVEMTETAAILNRADEKSFVILDEIGRGTSTFDGLSIAWATFEHLHKTNKSRALFATHYHELTGLADSLARAQNATVRVSTQGGSIRFLYEIISGISGKSYGIHVARLAGLPPAVLERASRILDDLESGGLTMDFPAPSETAQEKFAPKSEVENALSKVNPDEMSPKDALETLYMLKALLT